MDLQKNQCIPSKSLLILIKFKIKNRITSNNKSDSRLWLDWAQIRSININPCRSRLSVILFQEIEPQIVTIVTSHQNSDQSPDNNKQFKKNLSFWCSWTEGMYARLTNFFLCERELHNYRQYMNK